MLKGLGWIDEYLQKEMNLKSVGLDAVSVFLEASITSPDPAIQMKAGSAARRLASMLVQYFMKMPEPLDGMDLTDIMDFLADAKYHGLDLSDLLKKANRSFDILSRPEEIYGAGVKDLGKLSEDDLYDLLMCVYCVEKANVIYTNRFYVDFQMSDLLKFIKQRDLVSFTEDTNSGKGLAEDHAYLATHLAYIFNNYGRLKLNHADAPWIYDHLRRIFIEIMDMKDVELVGEFVDVFRSLGFTEENDEMVRTGTRFLLDTQNRDGSWGNWQKEKDPYDAIHYTWCAISGLRERVFLEDTPYHKRIREIFKVVNE